MRILYISDLFSGLKPVFVEGKENPEGSPAFFEPLKRILEENHQVDFVFPVFKKLKHVVKVSKFLQNSKILFFHYNNNIILRPFVIIRLFLFLLYVCRKGKYDFVYCHGSFGVYGNIAANILKIPAGHRIYGSFLYYRLQDHSKLYLAIRYYRQYLPFLISKQFMLMTNDGTQGDKLYRLIGSKSYNFYFELNGVDKRDLDKFSINRNSSKIILIYPARIDFWKNQEYAIKVLSELNKICGNRNIELHFIGAIYNENYYNFLQDKAKSLGVDKQIVFHGSLSKDQLYRYYDESFAVMSFYNYSNLGNISIETLTRGCLLLSINDGSLDKVVKHDENAILVESPKEGANWLNKLINENENYIRLRKNAFIQSNEIFRTWEERSKFEIELIYKSIS